MSPSPSLESSAANSRLPLLLSMLCVTVTQLGVSIYLPALPAMARELSLDAAAIQPVVTLYLLAFGASQLIYGPLADAIGRRPVFRGGLVISILGSVLCIFAGDSLQLLLIGRVLQGLGAGGCTIISRTLLRDSYQGKALLSAITWMTIMASLMPMLAPALGGGITEFFGWRTLFGGVLGALCLILAIGWFSIKDTREPDLSALKPRQIVEGYVWLLRQRAFICNASFGWATLLMWMVSLTAMPFLMQEKLGMSAGQYGQLMMLPSVGFLLGGILANRLKNRLESLQLLGWGNVLLVLCGVWMLNAPLSVWHLVANLVVMSLAAGLASPAAMMRMMEPFEQQAGSVAALSGAVQMILPGLLAGQLAKHMVHDHQLLGMFYLVMCVLLCFSWWWQKQRESAKAPLAARS